MKRTFTIDDKEYAVLEPTAKIRQQAQVEHSRVLGELMRDEKILTRQELENLIENRKIWSKEENDEYKKLLEFLPKARQQLEQGNMKLSEAKSLALEISDKRSRLNNLMTAKRQYDEYTVEGKAEEAEHAYLVSHCCVDNTTGAKVYKDIEDYLENKNTPLGILASINMMQVEYGSTEEIYKQLPENQFLLEWGFINDDLRFVNKDGKLVDRDGNLVNEDGNAIDENGNVLDKPIEKKPFLDDDGNPVEPPNKNKSEIK